MLIRMLGLILALLTGTIGVNSHATQILAGTPINTVPSALSDPLSTLPSPLPSGDILVPVQITGASGLQDWSFDLEFDGNVVQPLNLFGLFQSVYQSEFNSTYIALSDITASGFPGVNVLQGISGFSFGVSGDGTLAYVLFQFLPDQQNGDPSFRVDNVKIAHVPEPGNLALLGMSALLCTAFTRQVRTGRTTAKG